MQEQNLFCSFSQFAVDWWAACKDPGILFPRSWPEFVFVKSSNQRHRLQFESNTMFFERRRYFDYDDADKHRRIYHISRGRPSRNSNPNRMINENTKSNDRQSEARHEGREAEPESVWQAWKDHVHKLHGKSASVKARIWSAIKRLLVLLHDQSIWVFQQRRIQRVIGHKAQCAVLNQHNVMIVNRGDDVSGDSVLLALKFHVLSDLLRSVECGGQNIPGTQQPARQVEYRLDQWWPPYI